MHKTKSAKEKRKLREKRRATGVIHLPSESTGDSLDDDEEREEAYSAHPTTVPKGTNNNINEHKMDDPLTPVDSHQKTFLNAGRNKSSSDLDADLEDNQDYDSTVSYSETNLAACAWNSLPPAKPLYAGKHKDLESRPAPTTCKLSSYSTPAAPPKVAPRFQQIKTSRESAKSTGDAKTFGNASNQDSMAHKTHANTVDHPKLSEKLQMENLDLKAKVTDLEREVKWLRLEVQHKDERIQELTREVLLLDEELDELDTCNLDLVAENKALQKALSSVR